MRYRLITLGCQMNRNHSLEKYREIVQSVRLKLPEASLFSDLIVGFTGETERKPGYLKGLTEGKINIRFQATRNDLTGTFVYLTVTGSKGLSLEGSLSRVRVTSLAMD